MTRIEVSGMGSVDWHGTRRERVRASTVQEIRQVARRLLLDQGSEGVSLRAIAREMGMTAPALYRYFENHEALLTALADDLFAELCEALEAARDAEPPDDVVGRLYAVSRAFRQWSVDHRREFTVLFGQPLPGLAEVEDCPAPNSMRFGQIFLELFVAQWHRQPFPILADDQMLPGLRRQLATYAADIGLRDVPLGALQTFLTCWVRLYGLVALEVFNHLTWALTEAQPLFEAGMIEAAQLLGVEPRPPVDLPEVTA